MKRIIDPRLGENIRLQRKKKGMSLEEISYLTGISKSQLGRIERAESFPSDTILRKIEDALELPYGELERTKRKIEVDASIEQLVSEIKIDLMGRSLLERDMKVIAYVTKSMADAMERYE